MTRPEKSPLALEEVLDALVEREVGRVPRTTRRLAMYRVLHRLSEAVYDSPDRDARNQPCEAAFRLLIEGTDRG